MSGLWVLSDGRWGLWRACCRLEGRCGAGRVVVAARFWGVVHRQRGGGVAWSVRVLWAVAGGVGAPPRLGAGAKAGASTPPAPPPAPSAPSSSAPSRPIKQWRGRTGHPPQTNPPSSTQRASSSTQSSPGALMRRALAAVSSRCSPHGDRRGRRAVLLEWTGGGRQGRSGVPHSGVVVWRSALLLGMDAVAVQSDSGACVRGCGGCVWFVGGAPGCFVCCAAGSSRRCVTAPLSARPRRVVLCRTA